MPAWIVSIGKFLASIFAPMIWKDVKSWVDSIYKKFSDSFKTKSERKKQSKEDEEFLRENLKAGSDPGLSDEERIAQRKKAHEDYINHFNKR